MAGHEGPVLRVGEGLPRECLQILPDVEEHVCIVGYNLISLAYLFLVVDGVEVFVVVTNPLLDALVVAVCHVVAVVYVPDVELL